jgi:hypothetical protein
MKSSFDVGMIEVVIDFIDVNLRDRAIFVMTARKIPKNAVSREDRHPGKRCLCLTLKKA